MTMKYFKRENEAAQTGCKMKEKKILRRCKGVCVSEEN
jgi:hypothetical protein